MAGRCEKVAQQIDRRTRGLKISDRLVSLSDPDARLIRKGKLGRPTEFGFVAQICEVTENTRRGARGFILTWSGSTLLSADDAIGAIREPRKRDGEGLQVWGSASLAAPAG